MLLIDSRAQPAENKTPTKAAVRLHTKGAVGFLRCCTFSCRHYVCNEISDSQIVQMDITLVFFDHFPSC